MITYPNTFSPVPPVETPGLHRACWQAVSRATAAGAPAVSYLVPGQVIPPGTSVLACVVCGDRWVMAQGSPWVVVLRRALLAIAIFPVERAR